MLQEFMMLDARPTALVGLHDCWSMVQHPIFQPYRVWGVQLLNHVAHDPIGLDCWSRPWVTNPRSQSLKGCGLKKVPKNGDYMMFFMFLSLYT